MMFLFPPFSRHHGVSLVVRFVPSSAAAAESAIGHMTGAHPAIMQAFGNYRHC